MILKVKKGKLPKLWPKLHTRKNPKIKGIPQYDPFAVEFRDILLNSSKYNMGDIEKYFFNFNCDESPFNETLHSIFLMRVDESLVVSINLFNCIFLLKFLKI